MTTRSSAKRQSHCIVCGKRLSTRTVSGDIKWQASHVDDKGLYCGDCFAAKGAGRGKRPAK